MFWPDVYLTKYQKDIMYSVNDNKETFCPAGNALGKDFISALVAIWFFCSRRPARVVTTSVKHDQLNDVLWGEIRNFINTCKYDLPFQYNHMLCRQVDDDGKFVPKAELVGQVVSQHEGLLGRHLPQDIPRTLVIFDEASGIDTAIYESTDTWAHRKLVIGNPYPCNNFFFKGVEGGDLVVTNPYSKVSKCVRKVIHIQAIDSPNVRLGLAQEAAGEIPTNETLVPGLISYETYKERRLLWDEMRQSIGLDGKFYKGGKIFLYPDEWLKLSMDRADAIADLPRQAKAMGVDTAEGGDSTAWAIVDEYGLIQLISEKTPDTSVIGPKTLMLMREFNIPARSVMFDQGGGGKVHGDLLRSQGHKVRMTWFGEAATDPNKFRRLKSKDEKIDESETKTIYKNRRAEMYGILRQLLNPHGTAGFGDTVTAAAYSDKPQGSKQVFALPRHFKELHRQLAPIPLWWDSEGRLELPPKHKPGSQKKNATERETMESLIGCSPDEADALVLAVFCLTVKALKKKLKSLVK